MYRPLLAALALALAACGSDGPETVDVSRARLVIVSGDGQTGAVPPPPASSAIVVQATSAGGLLSEPLVVRAVTAGGAPSSSLVGPSFALVPAGTPVHWRVEEEGCGEPFGSTTVTDDSAFSVNRWRVGTRAGTCHMIASRILADGSIVDDSVFVATIEPGPPTFLGNITFSAPEGDSVDLREPPQGFHAHDWFFNPIPAEMLISRWSPTWEVLETDPDGRPGSSRCSLRVYVTGSGWIVPALPRFMPEPYTSSSYCIRIYFDGHSAGLFPLGVMHP